LLTIHREFPTVFVFLECIYMFSVLVCFLLLKYSTDMFCCVSQKQSTDMVCIGSRNVANLGRFRLIIGITYSGFHTGLIISRETHCTSQFQKRIKINHLSYWLQALTKLFASS